MYVIRSSAPGTSPNLRTGADPQGGRAPSASRPFGKHERAKTINRLRDDLVAKSIAAVTTGRFSKKCHVVVRGRPNSRVHSRHLDSFQGQPVIHIEFEAAVRVHMIPDQRRQCS